MPATKNATLKLAKKSQWQYITKACRGGLTKFFLITDLPMETQRSLQATSAGPVLSSKTALTTWPTGESTAPIETVKKISKALRKIASEQGVDRSYAKLMILRALDEFTLHHVNVTKLECLVDFKKQYNADLFEVDFRVRYWFPSVSESTLISWKNKIKLSGTAGLEDSRGRPNNSGIISRSPELIEFAETMFVAFPHIDINKVYKALQARFEERIDFSVDTFYRWARRWLEENKQLFVMARNPDEWKNKYKVAFGNCSEGVTEPNELWEFDSTSSDVELDDGIYSVVGVIDVYTRRCKFITSKTSNAVAVSVLARYALLNWGVPKRVKTDRGPEYVSNHLIKIFKDLNINHQPCPPRSPWTKPFIERACKSLLHDMLELLEDFLGHNVAQKQEIRSRHAQTRRSSRRENLRVKMRVDEFKAFLDTWCEVYLHRTHSGLSEKSPSQVAAEWQGPILTLSNERELDVLLAPVPRNDGLRKVGKAGIQLPDGYYFAPEMGEFSGRKLVVRYNPFQPGWVFVFDPVDSSYLFCAQNPSITGADRAALAQQATKHQNAFIHLQLKRMKQLAKELNMHNVHSEILAWEKKVLVKPVESQPQQIEHHTDALDSFGQAIASWERRILETGLTSSHSNHPGLYTIGDTLAHEPTSLEQFEAERLRLELDESRYRHTDAGASDVCAISSVNSADEASHAASNEEPCERYVRLLAQSAVSPQESAWMNYYERTSDGQLLLEYLERVDTDR